MRSRNTGYIVDEDMHDFARQPIFECSFGCPSSSVPSRSRPGGVYCGAQPVQTVDQIVRFVQGKTDTRSVAKLPTGRKRRTRPVGNANFTSERQQSIGIDILL